MYARQGKHVEALRSLSLDAYYSSLAVGPEDIATATAYFLLGEVFAAKVSDSDAVDRVCDSMTVSLASHATRVGGRRARCGMCRLSLRGADVLVCVALRVDWPALVLVTGRRPELFVHIRQDG
jgi:hypothetical protein